MTDYSIHPAAAAFALMSGDALDALVADIRARGVVCPIVVDADGVLLDGRNRLAACRRLGIAPPVVGYGGDDPVGFILSVNVHRRHLSKGQRAMAIAKLYPDGGKGGRGSKNPVLNTAGISSEYVKHARTVLHAAPDAVDAVVAGTLALNDAYAAIPKEAKRRAPAAADLPPLPPPSDNSPATSAKRADRLRLLAADGYSIAQAAPLVGISEESLRLMAKRYAIDMPGERAVRGTHRHNADRILGQTVLDAENVVADVGLIRLDELSVAALPDWITRLRRARTGLSQLIRTLEGVERVSPNVESRRTTDRAVVPVDGEQDTRRAADPVEDLPGGARADAPGARARHATGI